MNSLHGAEGGLTSSRGEGRAAFLSACRCRCAGPWSSWARSWTATMMKAEERERNLVGSHFALSATSARSERAVLHRFIPSSPPSKKSAMSHKPSPVLTHVPSSVEQPLCAPSTCKCGPSQPRNTMKQETTLLITILHRLTYHLPGSKHEPQASWLAWPCQLPQSSI